MHQIIFIERGSSLATQLPGNGPQTAHLQGKVRWFAPEICGNLFSFALKNTRRVRHLSSILQKGENIISKQVSLSLK